jgi:hypothetical protein
MYGGNSELLRQELESHNFILNILAEKLDDLDASKIQTMYDDKFRN